MTSSMAAGSLLWLFLIVAGLQALEKESNLLDGMILGSWISFFCHFQVLSTDLRMEKTSDHQMTQFAIEVGDAEGVLPEVQHLGPTMKNCKVCSMKRS